MKRRLSSENHQERRNSANFQRGNTEPQRLVKSVVNQYPTETQKAITDVINEYPEEIKSVLDLLNKSECHNKRVEKTKYEGHYNISASKLDMQWEENKISIVMNKETWTQSIRIEPQWKNKEKYYYLAEKVSKKAIRDEIAYGITLLNTGFLPSASSIKKIETISNLDDFDPSEWLPDEVVEKTWFSQKTRDKILAEEGPEEAAKYGKWLRWEKK